MRNVLYKIKIHILCSITFFRKSCRSRDNVKKCGEARLATHDNIIRCLLFSCWITTATNTQSEYVIPPKHTHSNTDYTSTWFVAHKIARILVRLGTSRNTKRFFLGNRTTGKKICPMLSPDLFWWGFLK